MADIGRRQFLKGAALGVAGIAAAGTLGACAPKAEETPQAGMTEDGASAGAGGGFEEGQYAFEIAPDPIPEDQVAEAIDVDICVIGAGLAGTTAALAAGNLGAKTIVLQKAPQVHTFGRIAAVWNAEVQKEAGIELDTNEMLSVWNTVNFGFADTRVVKMFLETSGECIDFINRIAEENGLEHKWEVHPNGQQFIQWSDASNYHRQLTFCQQMTPVIEGMGVEYRYNTPAIYLEQDDSGRVTGVIAHDDRDDKYIRVNASKGVIVCTGDIGNDEKMVEKYAPPAVGVPSAYIGGYDTGDGQKMMMWAGAQMQKLPYCSGIHLDPTTLPEGDAPWSDYSWLAVTTQGKRFMNEGMWYQSKVAAALTQTDIVFYQIGGPDMKTFCEENPDARAYTWDDAYARGAIIEAASVGELAGKIGVDEATLEETVARYNELYEAGVDGDFGKPAEDFASTYIPPEGPIYAIKRSPGALGIFGGAATTPRLEVLDGENNVVEGLYAAGLTVGRFYGYEYPQECGATQAGRCLCNGIMAVRFALGDA